MTPRRIDPAAITALVIVALALLIAAAWGPR